MTLAVTRWQDQIDAEAVLDGFYVLRTPSPRTSSTRPPWSPRTAIPLTFERSQNGTQAIQEKADVKPQNRLPNQRNFGLDNPARHPGQTQTRPDLCQAGLARHGPRVAWLRGSVFRATLNAQTEGCVSRRDLRLTTVRQGEQGRWLRHVPELRPPNHRVYNHRCTGSIRAPGSSPTLRCCSATVTQAISELVAAASARL